jgi:CheY-like chemotaxis protein
VKELVERMGGQIGVESHYNENTTLEAAGSGSTFWFTLPLKEAKAPEVTYESKKQILQNIDYEGNLRVLLVDDNEINQRLASVMLRNIGCEVTTADNGQEAIKELLVNDFQLILMDIQMPLMNGYEATEYIRNKLNRTTPIIGLSANVYKEEIQQCYHSGMNDYLGKPYTERSLREKVLKWAPIFTEAHEEPLADAEITHGKLTDLSFLIQLFNDDEESIKEMVRDFISQQQQMMEEMAVASENRKYDRLSDISHNMRSSIVAVGLEALREPLLALETLAKFGQDHEAVIAKFTEVQSINQAAIDELNKTLK